jgi:hypothetical protein
VPPKRGDTWQSGAVKGGAAVNGASALAQLERTFHVHKAKDVFGTGCVDRLTVRLDLDTLSFPKEGQVARQASFVMYPSRSKSTLFLLSAAQRIAKLFDLEACPANLTWPFAAWEYYGIQNFRTFSKVNL